MIAEPVVETVTTVSALAEVGVVEGLSIRM